jgi:hypothetical protein
LTEKACIGVQTITDRCRRRRHCSRTMARATPADAPKAADDQGAPNRPPTHRCERGRKPLRHREVCWTKFSFYVSPTAVSGLKTSCC